MLEEHATAAPGASSRDDLRVLFVSSGWPTDEHPHDSIFVARQANALRRAGAHVGVVSYAGRLDPRNYLRARRAIAREVAAGRYDVVHAHFGQSTLAIPRSDLPVVMTFWGSDLLGVVGAGGRYTTKGRVLRAISRWGAHRADAVVVQSERLGRQLPDGVSFTLIPHGPDLEVFRPADKSDARRRLGLDPVRRYVLFSGRSSQPVKRLDLAQRVIAMLPVPGAELIVLEGRTSAEVALTMAASDALLVTSMHESGPFMVKEALACDLPVVSVDVGDVREWITGVPGCELCVVDEAATIGAALGRTLARPEPFRGRHVVERLTDEDLVGRLLGVYRSVVRSPR
jgi:teichuronic acid biosynthesis glycosyltransferase TuaC